MGKGEGKGEGKGACNCQDTPLITTNAGKTAHTSSIIGAVIEGVGLAVNAYPACCMCCMVEAGGWCMCFVVMLGSISAFAGNLVLCCCKKDQCGMKVMMWASAAAVVIRLMALIIISVEVGKVVGWRDDAAADKNCINEYDDLWDVDDSIDCYTGEKNGWWDNEEGWTEVLNVMIAAQVIVAIWLIASLVSLICGLKGGLMNKESGVPAVVATVEIPPAGLSQVAK